MEFDRRTLRALCIAHKALLKLDGRSSTNLMRETLQQAGLLTQTAVNALSPPIPTKSAKQKLQKYEALPLTLPGELVAPKPTIQKTKKYEALPLTLQDELALQDRARLIEDNATPYKFTGHGNAKSKKVKSVQILVGLLKTLGHYLSVCATY